MKYRSIYWETLCNLLDKFFPKKESKERGQAMVLISCIEMLMLGTQFDENGEPVKEKEI